MIPSYFICVCTDQTSWEVRLGAIIVLLSLAIDPFSQQLVQLRQDITFTEDTTTAINRAIRYSKGYHYSDSSQNISIADADYSMQSAIFYGLSNSEQAVSQQLNFTCPSGNCTWESPVESLAVCSKCANLSSLLERHADNHDICTLLRGLALGGRFPVPQVGNRIVIPSTYSPAYQLPNGLTINNPESWVFPADGKTPSESGLDFGGTIMTTLGTDDPTMTNSLKDMDTLIWSTSLLKIQRPRNKDNTTVWPNFPLEALECGLYYCVNRYHPTVDEGSLVESAETVPFVRLLGPIILPLNLTTDGSMEEYYSLDGMKLVTNEGNFSVSLGATDSISKFFENNFAGPLTDFNSSKADGVQGRLNGFIVTRETFEWARPSTMRVLWSQEDIPALFTSIARSMSNALRDGADDEPGKVVTGRSGALVTSYQVQWGWIAMHVAVFLGGLFFLLATMARSNGRNSAVVVPIWKEDALASLNFGSQLGNVFGPNDSVKEMKEVATKHEGRLQTKLGNVTGNLANDSLETLM